MAAVSRVLPMTKAMILLQFTSTVTGIDSFPVHNTGGHLHHLLKQNSINYAYYNTGHAFRATGLSPGEQIKLKTPIDMQVAIIPIR